jgi:C-terminal domain of 1-Cys peroxiredoxin
MMTYPASTGRNMKELLRCIDAVQLTFVSQVATPVNWKRGDECLVDYSLNDEQANQVFGVDGYRIIKVPSESAPGFASLSGSGSGSSTSSSTAGARLPRHYMRYTKDPSAGFVRRMIQKLLQQPKPPKQ